MGLFDFLGGDDASYTPQQQQLAQQSGVDPAQVKAAQQQGLTNMLLHFGGTMLAAGQAGPIGSRGRILAEGLGNMQAPDVNKSILNSQQMQLYAQNLAQKKQDMALTQQARAKINGMDDLTDAQKTGAMLDPVGFLKQQSASDLALSQSKATAQAAFDQKVEQLTAAGMDPERAKAMAAGAIGEGKGMLGQTVLTDFRTSPMGGGGIPTLGGVMGGGGAPASPAAGGGMGGGTPAGGGVPAPQPNPYGTAAKVTDYGKAFGPGSWWQQSWNNLQGKTSLTLGHPETQDAQNGIHDLNNLITTTLAGADSAIGGKNTNFTSKAIKSQLPEPDKFFSSPEDARSQYRAVAAHIDDEMGNILKSPITDPKEISKLTDRYNQLQTVRNRLQVVLGGWGKGDVSEQAASNSQQATQGQQIPTPQQRVVGQVYPTPKGPHRWMGSGWQAVQ